MLYRILLVCAALMLLAMPGMAADGAAGVLPVPEDPIPEAPEPEGMPEQAQRPEPVPHLSLAEEPAMCFETAEAQPPKAGSAEKRALPDNWNPALCWRCGDLCTSDDPCFGKNAGDRCSNDGRTCVAFSGCALFNCCRCR